MADHRRRKRKRRAHPRRFGIIAAAVLALAALGVGITLTLDHFRQETARMYPMAYVDSIRANAAQNGLEPAHVAAIVLAESSYDPLAVSPVGAQGLMQVMPETGEWIAGKLDETYTEGCLFDPETNLRYGCWYLGFLMNRYGGDRTCATAAYHSGQGTVDGWLKDPEYSTDGRTLNVIGGKNANTYVSRVLEYYEKYEKLYRN